MNQLRKDRLNSLMGMVSPESRYRWCDKGLHACKCYPRSCSTVMGALRENGFTEQDWLEWVNEHPEGGVPAFST